MRSPAASAPTADQLLRRIRRRVNESRYAPEWRGLYGWHRACDQARSQLQALLRGYPLPSMHEMACESQRAALAHLSNPFSS